MRNIARYTPSANLTVLGLMYALAALVQMWFWGSALLIRHPEWVPTLLHTIWVAPVGGKIFYSILMLYHLMFAWTILELFYIGCRLLWLNQRNDMRILQTDKHRWEAVKATCFLLVVFFIAFLLVPSIGPVPEVELPAVELMGLMMFGYSLMAVAKYRGSR